jgi:Uma2 family endonuclease
MAFAQRRPLYTVEEYLALERDSLDRHEYLDGEIYAMAGESLSHGRICTNLTTLFGLQLRGKPCEALSKDMKVRSGSDLQFHYATKGLFAYPDLPVVCGEPQFHDRRRDILLNPTAIIEVLSDSTEAYDRGEKFWRYRTDLPSLTDYLLVAQDKPLVEHYRRLSGDRWELITVEGLEATVSLDSIQCLLRMIEVYDRVIFPAETDEQGGEEALTPQ